MESNGEVTSYEEKKTVFYLRMSSVGFYLEKMARDNTSFVNTHHQYEVSYSVSIRVVSNDLGKH